MLEFFNYSGKKFNPLNLKKQRIPPKKIDKAKGIIKWQTDGSRSNDFPQQLIQNVYNSPVGSSAVDVWSEFISGDGLLDKVAGEMVINEKTGMTLNDLHALLSPDLSSMDGIAIIQRYSPEGLPTERLHLPFEETRLGIPDKTDDIKRIYHNPYYGMKEFKDQDTRWFYDYNPDPEHVKAEMIAHNIEFKDKKTGTVQPPYPGQAFWFSIEKPLARVYPQPFYYSSINWFIVDAEIQSFHERNIKNNMLLSVLINMHGDPTVPAGPQDDTKDTTDKTQDQRETVGDMMNRQMKTFTNEKGGVLINWFKKDEEKATFEAFPTNSHHDLFTALQNIVADQIAIGTKVPRILLNIGQAGKLGDTQEILNAIRVMQGVTRRKRNILKKTYETVFGIPDGTIKNVNPVNIIPDAVWGALTSQEQRKYISENFDIEIEITDQPPADTEEVILEPSENGR